MPPIKLRAIIEDEIERLIALLDLIEGDPDLEPEPIEPDADFEPSAYGCADG